MPQPGRYVFPNQRITAFSKRIRRLGVSGVRDEAGRALGGARFHQARSRCCPGRFGRAEDGAAEAFHSLHILMPSSCADHPSERRFFAGQKSSRGLQPVSRLQSASRLQTARGFCPMPRRAASLGAGMMICSYPAHQPDVQKHQCRNSVRAIS